MDRIETVVLAALRDTTGYLTAPEVETQIAAGADFSFDGWSIDSLSRFEAMMMIGDALGVELDDDQVSAQGSFRALCALVRAQAAA